MSRRANLSPHSANSEPSCSRGDTIVIVASVKSLRHTKGNILRRVEIETVLDLIFELLSTGETRAHHPNVSGKQGRLDRIIPGLLYKNPALH